LSCAITGLGEVKFSFFVELWKEVGGTFDGSGNELGEEADEGVVGWFEFAAIDVDGVTEGLKGVKTNPDGQDDIQRIEVGVDAQTSEQINERVGKKVVVFEETEYAEIDRDPSAMRPYADQSQNRPANSK